MVDRRQGVNQCLNLVQSGSALIRAEWCSGVNCDLNLQAWYVSNTCFIVDPDKGFHGVFGKGCSQQSMRTQPSVTVTVM